MKPFHIIFVPLIPRNVDKVIVLFIASLLNSVHTNESSKVILYCVVATLRIALFNAANHDLAFIGFLILFVFLHSISNKKFC